MLRKCFALSALAAACLFVSQSARAHMVFVVPDAGNKTATVLMSEELKPDAGVPIKTISGIELTLQNAAGTETPVAFTDISKQAYGIQLGDSPRVVYGQVDLGVVQHGPSKPNWLRYYPKTIVGNALDDKATLGRRAPVELVPVGTPGKLQLKLLADGKPVPAGQVICVPAEGDQESYETDAAGLTPVIEKAGRLGFWARNIQKQTGEKNGKKFEEIRRYATLVIDAPTAESTAAAVASPTTAPTASLLPVEAFVAMPQPASSFGAVEAGGYLYVYGGHVADTHDYSTQSVSGQFHRLKLADTKTWEALPPGPHLQGMNLATYDGRVYRVGGMSPLNKDGEADDVRSVADVSAYDPAAGTWTPLPALPEARSSHDLAVIDGKLFVIGGWTLTGEPGSAGWPEQMLSLDLKDKNATWQKIDQPFKRRALIAAAHAGKIYAIGGFDSDDTPSLAVNIFDTATGKWSTGPSLPTPTMNGFGPAACVAGNRLFASVGDGSLLRLSDNGKTWERIAKTTPRIVHRLIADGDRVLVLGGAMKRKQVDLIEAVRVVPSSTAIAR